MEIVIFIIATIICCVGLFWIAGGIYGLTHRPALYFPLSLAAKMALAALAGVWFFGLGGIALATYILNSEMIKRQDYRRWPTIIAGVIISTLCSIAMFFLLFTLAWGILE
jgi:hypothetical protein